MNNRFFDKDTAVFVTVVIAMMAMEASATTFFFRQMNDGGALSGVQLTIAMGLINVLLAVTAGFIGWALIERTKPFPRTLVWAVIVSCILLAVAIHLLLGDVREAVTIVPPLVASAEPQKQSARSP